MTICVRDLMAQNVLTLKAGDTVALARDLMAMARKITGIATKREVVEEGLKTLIRLNRQEDIRKFRGKLHWEGDLDAMRSDL